MTKQFQPGSSQPMNHETSTFESATYGSKVEEDDNAQIAQVLSAQVRFAELDAGEVEAYTLIIVHKEVDENGDVVTAIEVGGRWADKIFMLDSLIKSLKREKELILRGSDEH